MTSIQESEKKKGVILLSGILFYIRNIILAFLLVFAILFVCKLFDFRLFNVVSSPEFKENVKNHLWVGVILISFLGPLVEESIFRLWLSFKRVHVFISVFVISYYALTKLLGTDNHESIYGLISYNLVHFAFIKIICSTCISSCIFLVSEPKYNRFKSQYGDSFSRISVLIFALMHITNLICPWYAYPLAILLCTPQLILGIVVTNFRRNLGFVYGLAFHCVINLFNFIATYGTEIVRQTIAR